MVTRNQNEIDFNERHIGRGTMDADIFDLIDTKDQQPLLAEKIQLGETQ